MRSSRLVVLVVAIALALARPAAAQDTWLLGVDAPAALALSQPQSSRFGVGAAPAASLYRGFGPWLLLGVRGRGAALIAGEPPSDPTLSPAGTGGLASLSLAVRLRPLAHNNQRRGTGPWIEVAGGPALTGDLVRASVEAGIGWGFQAGSVNIGPSLRYLRVIQPTGGLDTRDAHLALFGMEVSFLDSRPSPPAPVPVIIAPRKMPEPPRDRDGDGVVDSRDACPDDKEDVDNFQDQDGCPDPDNDQDQIADDKDACPNEAEVLNGVDDEDGCPDEGLIVLKKDRIVLPNRVLFDFARARVKHSAKKTLEAVVELYRQHPEWEKMRVDGHSDRRDRGSDRNMQLSQRRADAVRDELILLGIPSDFLEAKGFGATQLIDDRRTEKAHSKNRRVELVVVTSRVEKKTEAKDVTRPANGDDSATTAKDPEPPASDDKEVQQADEPATPGSHDPPTPGSHDPPEEP